MGILKRVPRLGFNFTRSKGFEAACKVSKLNANDPRTLLRAAGDGGHQGPARERDLACDLRSCLQSAFDGVDEDKDGALNISELYVAILKLCE